MRAKRTTTTHEVINEVRANPGMTTGQLAAHLGVSHKAMSAQLNKGARMGALMNAGLTGGSGRSQGVWFPRGDDTDDPADYPVQRIVPASERRMARIPAINSVWALAA